MYSNMQTHTQHTYTNIQAYMHTSAQLCKNVFLGWDDCLASKSDGCCWNKPGLNS